MPDAPPPIVRKWDVALYTFNGLAVSAEILMGITPKFSEVYRQVKVPMPGSTLTLMTLSDLAMAWPLVVAILMTALPASVHAMSPRAIRIARVAIPLLSYVVWGVMICALSLPLLGCHLSIGSRR